MSRRHPQKCPWHIIRFYKPIQALDNSKCNVVGFRPKGILIMNGSPLSRTLIVHAACLICGEVETRGTYLAAGWVRPPEPASDWAIGFEIRGS